MSFPWPIFPGLDQDLFPPHGFPRFLGFDSKTVQRSALCRSRRELSNAYLLAKIGVDTAENEPLEVWGENSIHYSLHSLLVSSSAAGLPGAARRGPAREKREPGPRETHSLHEKRASRLRSPHITTGTERNAPHSRRVPRPRAVKEDVMRVPRPLVDWT